MRGYCETCRWWDQQDGSVGLCRVHAPIEENDTDGMARWPMTYNEDWCGDFASREQLTLSDIVLSPEIITKES